MLCLKKPTEFSFIFASFQQETDDNKNFVNDESLKMFKLKNLKKKRSGITSSKENKR